ncbi:hypothetical protein AB0M39_40350, partial [Streptomyces sp. NPDC051907]
EALMPLKLAKFGVPLADTAPAGLAAAGVDPVLLPPSPLAATVQRVDAQPASAPQAVTAADEVGEGTEHARESEASPWSAATRPARCHEIDGSVGAQTHQQPLADFLLEDREAQFQRDGTKPDGTIGIPEPRDGERPQGRPGESYFLALREFAHAYGQFPDGEQLARYTRELYGPRGPGAAALTPEALAGRLAAFRDRFESELRSGQRSPDGGQEPVDGQAEEPAISVAPDTPLGETGDDEANGTVAPPLAENEEHLAVPTEEPLPAAAGHLTVVDRYFQAWDVYRQRHGREPKDTELSQFLAEHRILSRTGGAVKPSTLRRYFLEFRIYKLWALQREDHATPQLDDVVEGLAELGVTAQYGQPITAEFAGKFLPDFERRWNALSASLSRSPA